MNATVLPLLLLVASADEPPKAKVPVGKETTFVTGPIDKSGYIDYEAALNERLSKGITPDKNANALFWKAIGPKPEGDEMPPAYFKALGIEAPLPEGDYFIDLGRYMKDVLQLDQADFMTVYDQQGWATRRPWTAKDYPDVAAWLKANEKPLAVVVEATKRPAYFNPLVSRREDGEPSFLLGYRLANVQKCREIGTALAGRAMLKLGEGKADAAWDDLMAAHRLARHLTRGATLIEGLVAYANIAVTANTTLAYLERADLTAAQMLARLKELQNLPPIGSVADKIDLAERLMCLDSLQMVRSGRGLDGDEKPSEEDLKALDLIDWAPAFRNCNKAYDRMTAALRIKDRAEREKEFDAVDKDLEAAVKKGRNNVKDIQKAIRDPRLAKKVGEQIGNVLLGMMAPALRKVQYADDRAQQIVRNLHVAFALAAYHKDNSKYPAKLADLAPKYLKDVPDDLFSGKALIYKPNDKGYLFYSVGMNGKDDGGQWYGDDPPGDDPGVRMPLPPLKKN